MDQGFIKEEVVQMECPYCLEEVKDGAAACPHCGRDLSAFKLIKPTMDKVSALEKRIDSLEALILELRSPSTQTPRMDKQPVRPRGDQPTQERHRAPPGVALVAGVVAVFTPLVAVAPILLTSSDLEAPLEVHGGYNLVAYTLLLLLTPFLAGGVAGYFWWGRRRLIYASYGLIVGLLAMLGLSLVQRSIDFGNAALGFSTATLFVSGLLFGDLYEKRRRWRSQGGPTQQDERESVSVRAAGELAKLPDSSRGPSPTTTLLIQALGPAIVGLIGTVSTTLITVFLSGGG
jgi:hypothetical protein